MIDSAYSIEFRDVVQRFRLIHDRPDTLREKFANLWRQRTTYHDFEALKHVSFQVPRGQTVGIVGRNGSGKSTILKVTAGVYTPSGGCVRVNGTIAPLIELGAGFHHELTGRENILLNGLLLGLSKRQIQEREAEIIDFAELGDFIDSPIKQYSSGMYMRLAFSVAVAVDPDILLIDEILSVGDGGFRKKCFDLISDFRLSGKTILFVSHDMNSVRELCHRVLLLNNGEVIEDGQPVDVLAEYERLLGHRVPQSVS